jgi:hypothetical protein
MLRIQVVFDWLAHDSYRIRVDPLLQREELFAHFNVYVAHGCAC